MLKDTEIQEFKEVEVDKILINPYQPRKEIREEELKDLACSIQSVGLLHPPLVRPIAASDRYELVSGERRYRAAKLAGLVKIPVFIRQMAISSSSAEAALIENIQRVDLNPLEIAQALRRLMTDFGFSQDQLAQKIGKKRSTVANYLRLLSLPISIQKSVSNGTITMGHAKALLSVEEREQQMLLHDTILQEGWSVRKVEQRVSRMKHKKKGRQALARDCHLDSLVEKLQHGLGTKVRIQEREGGGQVIIDYYSLDDLDRLLHLWGIEVGM